MPTRVAVKTDKAPPPLPVYSQAIVCNGMVYCSGQVAMHPETKAMVEGGISDRTVSYLYMRWKRQRSFVKAKGLNYLHLGSMLQKSLGRT